MALEFKQQSWCARHESSPARGWYLHSNKRGARQRLRGWRGSWCKTHELGSNRAKPTDWQPFRGMLSHITETIESSRAILELTDDDGAPLVAKTAWERAANFLNNSARRLWSNQGVRIEAPDIGSGPDGSVDIHWDRANYEMLINVPADLAVPITFYGDDRRGNAVKGQTPSHDNRGLLLWLTTVLNK